MLRPVRPSLNFWYYLGIISSPLWVFSFLAMDFVKKRTGLVAVLLISTLVISGSNYVLSKLYFWLRRNPKAGRFFGGYERAGKSIGYVLLFFGNIGLYCYSEKSLASVLTFLFLAFYCLSTLFCIQPYTDFGVLEFLLSASMNQVFGLLGIRSYSSWLVIIACIFIGVMRYCLEPVHPPREAAGDEVQLPTSVHPPNTSASSSTFRFLTRRVKNRRAKKKYNSVKEDNGRNEGIFPNYPITKRKKGTSFCPFFVFTIYIFVPTFDLSSWGAVLQYDLGTIKAATNNFSDDNIIGEGGFGLVYKGLLSDGQEIAVKKLSRTSRQATQEFKSEMVLVAKLQHRNIVRLLGFCLRGEEKILIYEFVPNKSLNCFLFDPQEREKLDWSRRYKIISGVARGMLYLHEDSRLRVIHRDLKASNILLDVDMNAKITDFGLARIFGNDQTQGNINEVAGTVGYMSPEYLMHGKFSAKSDVFSFGVLVLEIISGKRNHSYQSNDATNLLSYAWKLWSEGTPLDLLDPTFEGSFARNEVTRCIHIALLCVQDDSDARPSMATIVLMLNSYSVPLSLPQQPRFSGWSGIESNIVTELQSDQSISKSIQWTVNEASISEVDPR